MSTLTHTSLCIQFLNRENNDKNNAFPLGKQICFTIVWGCAEILPRLLQTFVHEIGCACFVAQLVIAPSLRPTSIWEARVRMLLEPGFFSVRPSFRNCLNMLIGYCLCIPKTSTLTPLRQKYFAVQ